MQAQPRRDRPRHRSAVVAAERLTVLEILRRTTAWLGRRGVENPRLDAEILVAHGLGLGRLELYLAFDRPVDDEERARIRDLVGARGRREPVAYLVGEREFWSLAFHVDGRVLVPRPETEHLVEVALEALGACTEPLFADIGVGSGCVAVALLSELPGARAWGTDLSADALAVARLNADRHGVGERLELRQGDALEPLSSLDAWGRLDVVVSNPPYVLQDDPEVEQGVREHEPALAVFVPGQDATEIARRVAEGARFALRSGGLLALEVGYGQAEAVCEMLEALGYQAAALHRDLAGVERIVSARR